MPVRRPGAASFIRREEAGAEAAAAAAGRRGGDGVVACRSFSIGFFEDSMR